MSKGKLAKWVNDNIVMLVGIPLIIGIHYGWSKLQDVPGLVDQSHKKKELPIILAYRAIRDKVTEKLILGGSSISEPKEK